MFKHIGEMELLRKETIPQKEKRMIIVADLPYNEEFEARIISLVN